MLKIEIKCLQQQVRMIPDQRQLNLKVYKVKMNILLKVLLITLSSTLFVLLLFDYDSGKRELALPSQINCMTLGNNNAGNYACNTCFKVSPKDKFNQKITIQNTQPFLLVSLKPQISGIFTCQEWLQAIDYETVKSQNSKQQSLLRFEPSVNKFLRSLENQHNQILLTQKSQQKSFSSEEIFQVSSSLDRPYQVISFYSKTKQPSGLRIYQNNEEIKSTGIHILTLLTVAVSIALLYVFHCVEKKETLKKYNQHIFCVIGILGTFVWIIFGDLIEQYGTYLTFTKILFFSTVFDIVFGAGRWIFFGIILITQIFVNLAEYDTDFYRLLLDTVFILVVTGKLCSEAKKQYFHLQKNRNKKIYFLFMAFMILGCRMGEQIYKGEISGEVCQFLIGYLIMNSFIFGIKNLDGNDYQKLLKDQGKINPSQQTTQSTIQSTTMYEDHDQIEPVQLQKQVRK